MIPADQLAKNFQSDRFAETRVTNRANSLVNPKSGLANDYLNVFNEISMLIENYPAMPELGSAILSWRVTPYKEYFQKSMLPGRENAIEAWGQIDPKLHDAMLAITAQIENLAKIAKTYIKCQLRDEITAQTLEKACSEITELMRGCIFQATQMVNFGIAVKSVAAQERADQIMARLKPREASKSLS
ncbi:MAG: hypothetical protein KGQ46_11510 [Hyphomicrobiales bacterium]|nr:hypothetical protein [Hyphomicrobiales bacterium]MDE2113781.1 hypothetical protein [Hyphomicrobiales bacterium]